MSDPAAPGRHLDEVREEAAVSEWQRITSWRLDQLLRADYDTITATWLSEQHEIDLHLAVRLAAQAGPARAFRILY